MFELLLITALLAMPAALLTVAVRSLLDLRRDGPAAERAPMGMRVARSYAAFDDPTLPGHARSALLQRRYLESSAQADGLHHAVIRELHHRARRET